MGRPARADTPAIISRRNVWFVSVGSWLGDDPETIDETWPVSRRSSPSWKSTRYPSGKGGYSVTRVGDSCVNRKATSAWVGGRFSNTSESCGEIRDRASTGLSSRDRSASRRSGASPRRSAGNRSYLGFPGGVLDWLPSGSRRPAPAGTASAGRLVRGFDDLSSLIHDGHLCVPFVNVNSEVHDLFTRDASA